jgi:hypothetical protein
MQKFFQKIFNSLEIRIFFSSIIFSLTVLIIERIIGIGADYHPDSTYYLNYQDYAKHFRVGLFFHDVVYFFNSNVSALLTLNVVAFSLTNLVLYSVLKKVYLTNGWFYYISSLIVIFDPYRAHLSIHVLKDSLLILTLVLFLFSSNIIIKLIFLFMSIMLRLGFFIYFLMFFSFFKKKFTYILLIFTISLFVFIIFYYKIGLPAYQVQLDIRFRSFDNVYNFINFDFPFAQILRGITWPVIRITGLAVLFHPFYFLFLLQSVALMYIIYVNRRYVDYRVIFFILPLVIIATITNGYNSYLRWTQPIITVLSVWMLSLPLAHKENFYKKSQNK